MIQEQLNPDASTDFEPIKMLLSYGRVRSTHWLDLISFLK